MIIHIPIEKIKSKWYEDLFTQWQPDRDHIAFLRKNIDENQYMAPIVLVKEGSYYYIVNGHHRFYAHAKAGKKKIKSIVLTGTFEESEPLRKAEVLLKEYDQTNEYRYQFSGYLDRWAAAAEQHVFINKYRPTYSFRLKKILNKLLSR